MRVLRLFPQLAVLFVVNWGQKKKPAVCAQLDQYVDDIPICVKVVIKMCQSGGFMEYKQQKAVEEKRRAACDEAAQLIITAKSFAVYLHIAPKVLGKENTFFDALHRYVHKHFFDEKVKIYDGTNVTRHIMLFCPPSQFTLVSCEQLEAFCNLETSRETPLCVHKEMNLFKQYRSCMEKVTAEPRIPHDGCEIVCDRNYSKYALPKHAQETCQIVERWCATGNMHSREMVMYCESKIDMISKCAHGNYVSCEKGVLEMGLSLGTIFSTLQIHHCTANEDRLMCFAWFKILAEHKLDMYYTSTVCPDPPHEFTICDELWYFCQNSVVKGLNIGYPACDKYNATTKTTRRPKTPPTTIPVIVNLDTTNSLSSTPLTLLILLCRLLL